MKYTNAVNESTFESMHVRYTSTIRQSVMVVMELCRLYRQHFTLSLLMTNLNNQLATTKLFLLPMADASLNYYQNKMSILDRYCTCTHFLTCVCYIFILTYVILSFFSICTQHAFIRSYDLI